MNKLRKGRNNEDSSTTRVTRSRAMVLAQAAMATPGQGALISRPSSLVAPYPVKIETISEHYWAARAYMAETLLSVTTSHHEEMRQLRISEADRRAVSSRILSKWT